LTNNKILIVGIESFMGRHIADKALEMSFEISGIIGSNSTSDLTGVPAHNLLKGSFDKEEVLRKELKENSFNYVVYCSSSTPEVEDPKELHLINATHPLKLLKLITEEEVIPNKFVFISSCSAFGPADRQAKGILENSSYPHPVSEYGKSMLQAEKFIESFNHIPYLILRPGLVFGNGSPWIKKYCQLIKKGIAIQPPTSNQLLSCIHAEDLSALIFQSFETKISRQSFFVTDRELYKAETILNLLQEYTQARKEVKPFNLFKFNGLNPKLRVLLKYFNIKLEIPKDRREELTAESWNIDSSNLEIYYNFQPAFTLENGLRRAVEALKANRAL